MPLEDRLRKRLKKKLGLGGLIGGIAGGAAGSLIPIPGVGTAIGKVAGSFLGNQVENLIRGDGNDEAASVLPTAQAANVCNLRTGQGGMGNVNMAKGGVLPIGQDAIEFTGPRHEQGGVDIDEDIEVEGGETLDFLVRGGRIRKLDKGGDIPFVFSDRLKVPGSNVSFAKYHKQLVGRGAEDDDVKRLASLQERLNDKDGRRKLQEGGWLEGAVDTAGDFLKKNVTKENVEGAWDFAKNDVLPYLPSLLAVGKAATAKDPRQLEATPVDRSALRELDSMPTTVDVSPQLARQQASYRSILANPNISANQALAAHSQNLQNEAQIFGNQRNQETNLLAQKALSRSRLSAGFAQQDAANQSRVDAINLDNELASDAARDQMLIGGLQGIAGTYAGRRREQQMMEMQPLMLAASLSNMDDRTRNYYLGVLAEHAPEKYREVLRQLGNAPTTPQSTTTPAGTDVPVYGQTPPINGNFG